jgi:hypothetical protein
MCKYLWVIGCPHPLARLAVLALVGVVSASLEVW